MFFWIPVADARNFKPPSGWVTGFRNQLVDGEEAVLFKHPGRERAICKHIDDHPLTRKERLYVDYFAAHRARASRLSTF
ncbi:MAG: hypothetical protein RIU46_17965 [Deltaproteobacteria bacterium]